MKRQALRSDLTPLDQLDLTGIQLLDGGMATELEALGCDISGPLWSAHVLRDQPEKVIAVHRSYLEAGADCILTASYQVSEMGYREIGLAPEAAAHDLRKAVDLAEQARAEYIHGKSRRILIAASLGPYGAALHNGAEYHGNYDIPFSKLVDFHARRIEAISTTGADLIAFETVPLLEEAQAIVEALQGWPNLGAWISFTSRDEKHAAHGETIAECGRLLDGEPQIVAIGINCTAPHLVLPLLQELRSATAKPLVVYPNSGETWNPATRSWAGHPDPLKFAFLAQQWRAAGADIIGGCCRTGPEHVKAISSALLARAAELRNQA